MAERLLPLELIAVLNGTSKKSIQLNIASEAANFIAQVFALLAYGGSYELNLSHAVDGQN